MKKIMFNDKFCLTQAVLDGTKTMTRRVLKEGTPLGNWEETAKHLPYKVGEIVAIAQSYNDIYNELEAQGNWVSNEWWINASDIIGKGLDTLAGYKNKMFVKADFMPHHIRITDVKVERLRDISEEDALREGIFKLISGFYCFPNEEYAVFSTPRRAFAEFIDKVSGKGTWESNPFVVAYSFELVD